MNSEMSENRTEIPSLHELPKIFRKFPAIEAVYLFGSTATGTRHGESDLDLAIIPGDEITRHFKLDLLKDLARHGFCNVDLVVLDTNDIVMKYEAIRLNQLIYSAESFDPAETYSRIIRQYLDFLPYLDVQRSAFKRRILNGES
jgi:uncharacterized protein